MKYTFELIGIDEYNIYKNGKLYAKGQLPIMTEVFRNIEIGVNNNGEYKT